MACPNCGRKESGRPGQVEVSERCPNNCYNGRVLCSRCAGNGFYQDRHGDLVDCGKCNGGYMTDETCGGSGYVSRFETCTASSHKQD